MRIRPFHLTLAALAAGVAAAKDRHSSPARANADALAVELDGDVVWDAPAIDRERYVLKAPDFQIDCAQAETAGPP